MPTRPPQLCVVTGCPNLVTGGKCDEHRSEAHRDYGRTTDRRRPSAAARGYDRAWQRTRNEYLAANPYCQSKNCSQLPAWRRPLATDVDHIDGLGPNGPHGHDRDNLQALCHSCHSRKTAAENGGFGRG